MQTMFQSGTSATGSQYNGVIIDTYIFRIDDFVSLYILQHTVLMDTRRVRERISTHNRLVGLYRHVHQAGYHAAGRVNLLGIDIRIDINAMVTTENHGHFLQRRISGTFSDSVDSHLYLTGTVQYTADGIGSCHSQVVVAMGRNDSLIYTIDVIYQVLDFFTILGRKTITGSIRNIDHCSTCLDNSFHHTSQVFIFCTSGILSIEFYIIYITACILYCRNRTFDNFLTGRIELILDV